MKRMLAMPLLLLLAAQSPVQQPAPATPPTDANPPLGDLLSFGANGERMTVPVHIAGAGPYRFIIDTGAQRTVVSRELAGTLRLSAGPIVRVTAMTGVSEVATVVIPSITVGALGGERIEAPAFEGRFLGAPGMLGIDSLQGHALAIDFEKGSMVVSPSRLRPSFEHHDPDEIVVKARSLFGQLVVTEAYVGREKVRVILDTGSAVTMGNRALEQAVMRRGKKGVPITLTGVTGETVTVNYTALNTIKLGAMTINDMPIAYAENDAPPFKAFGLEKRPALMLGMDALKLFRRINIDFANREVRFIMPRNALTS